MKKFNILLEMMHTNQRLIFCLIILPFINISSVLMQSPLIESPKAGEVLQGIVSIKGSLNVANYKSYEVSFAYDGDDTQTWFLIKATEEKVNSRELAVWDTSKITDGDYKIQVKVVTSSESARTTIIEDLHVRNYTTFEYEDIEKNTNEDQTEVLRYPQSSNATRITTQPDLVIQNELKFSSLNIVNIMKYTIVAVIIIFLTGLIYLNKKNTK